MKKFTYLFLDEGGNFDFSSTGTKYFSLTCIEMTRPFESYFKLDHYKHDCLEYGLNTEYFHCSENNKYIRKKVFHYIHSHLHELNIDSLVVDKIKTKNELRDIKHFYPEMLGHLFDSVMKQKDRTNSEIIVITDSIPLNRKKQAVEKAIKETLKHSIAQPFRILHHASKSHYGLQIADYCNWAIFRKWEKGDTEFYEMLRKNIRSENNIFEEKS